MYIFTDEEWELVTECMYDGANLMKGNQLEEMGMSLDEVRNYLHSDQRSFTDEELARIANAYFGALRQLYIYEELEVLSNYTWDEVLGELGKLLDYLNKPHGNTEEST